MSYSFGDCTFFDLDNEYCMSKRVDEDKKPHIVFVPFQSRRRKANEHYRMVSKWDNDTRSVHGKRQDRISPLPESKQIS